MTVRTTIVAALLAAVFAVDARTNFADDGKRPKAGKKKTAGKKQAKLEPLSKGAQRVADELKKTLPPKSEARLMLDAILKGSRMGPNDGWFGVAKGETRFGWKYVAKTFDTNRDGKVTPQEFRGKPVHFRRLDRNGDGELTEADFAAGPPGFSASPGAMLFQMADRDGNGHVTKKEFAALFDSFDSGRRGFLSLDDLANALKKPSGRRRGKRPGPSRSTLVLALARQELGALQPGPALNERAPEFSLRIANDLKRVTLSKEIGDKPVVLIFGSFT
jgi:Ca2+-binding EF-hand superfamily protein